MEILSSVGVVQGFIYTDYEPLLYTKSTVFITFYCVEWPNQLEYWGYGSFRKVLPLETWLL